MDNSSSPQARHPFPALYVHIPFCLSRCGYCAFVSGLYDAAVADIYVEAVTAELAARAIFSSGANPSSIFIGGGTPSALSLSQLQSLLTRLPSPVSGGEYTCELNPDSTDATKLALLSQHGVNRCSFGVQTFSSRGLRLLGRRHDAATARRVVTQAVGCGFASVNIDLISGWPGQRLADVRDDLRIAVDLGVSHISCYSLIVEETSQFPRILAEHDLTIPDEDALRRIWDYTEEYLALNGYIHYETSNFAKPDHMCRHNLNTWKGGEYLGIGVAAHSHMDGVRFANTEILAEYIQNSGKPPRLTTFSEKLDPRDKAKECAIFWLRLYEGIHLEEFRERTGFAVTDLYADVLPRLFAERCLEYSEDGTHIRVPASMHAVLDSIVVELL